MQIRSSVVRQFAYATRPSMMDPTKGLHTPQPRTMSAQTAAVEPAKMAIARTCLAYAPRPIVPWYKTLASQFTVHQVDKPLIVGGGGKRDHRMLVAPASYAIANREYQNSKKRRGPDCSKTLQGHREGRYGIKAVN